MKVSGKHLFGALAAGAVGALLVAERKRPLRRRTRPDLARNIRNAAMGASCALVIALVEEPLTQRIARANAAGGRGIAQRVPKSLSLAVGVLAMDYGFYLWHVATHKLPFLWRWHRVHHIDEDMDASTAVRFHALDMLVSLPWRLVQVRLAGVDPAGLFAWRQFFNASILFHHSNLRLPVGWDGRLSLALTTPKMHGIHHSSVKAERDSNWTSGFSFWDRLHGTFRDTPAQDAIDIGVADPRAGADIALARSLTAPFRPIPPETR